MKQNRKLQTYWPLFFILVFLEAMAAFIVLLRVPGEGGHVLLGYSPERWAIMIPLLLSAGTSIVAAYISNRKPDLSSSVLNVHNHPEFFRWLALGAFILAILTGVGAYLLRWLDPETLLPYYERAWPLLMFILLASSQLSIWLGYLRYGIRKPAFESLKPTLVAFVMVVLVYGFISATKLGLIPDKSYWGEPGVPILGWQLLFALLCTGLFLLLRLFTPAKSHSPLTGFLIPLLIYCLALGLWLSVPDEVLRNSFYFPIDPPANMPYPYSDSGYYDYMAQSLLIGTGYLGEIPTRPLYIVFLTILHKLFGERYDLIIIGQTVVLAGIPVALYALARSIHSRSAGILVALLAIAREWTNLLVSSETRVSNTKTLLVDTPTLGLLVLTCMLTFFWLKRGDRLRAFIAGGAFGVLLLVRTQALVILPVVLLLAFLALKGSWPSRTLPLLSFVLGVALSTAPWLIHNYLQSGSFAFDAPMQLQVIASQYGYDGILDYGTIDLEGKSLLGIVIAFALKDPGFVSGFISNHLLATEIGSLLALPLVESFKGLTSHIGLYWTSFNGELAWYNQFLLLVYLAFFALGLGTAWRRWRWAGLTPMAFNIGYALSNGLSRFSGWRYDLPADWVVYFYFGLGFAEFLFWLASAFGAQKTRLYSFVERSDQKHQAPTLAWLAYACLFITIGATPWLAKGVFPRHFSERTAESIQAELISKPEMEGMADQLQTFVEQPDSVVMEGRLLYPRFFWRNSGLTSSNPWASYALRDYPRLGFLLLNQNVREIVLPYRGRLIQNLHAQDVQLAGCQRENYIEARLVAIPGENLVYLSSFGWEPCSP